jgi:uncharacterized protein YjaZ
MQFTLVDTEAAYRRILSTPDAAGRAAIFERELAAPFSGLVQMMGGDPAMFTRWVIGPEQLAADRGRRLRYLDMLAAHDAWARAARALEMGRAAFADHLGRIPPRDIVFGLFLSDMSAMPFQHGYSGFGAIPGYVMTVYDEPTAPNLARVEACTIHELHHNLRFRLFPFSPMTTDVADYIVAEGLAEAFAAEQYGEELIGPWVTEFDESRLEEARAVIGGALDRSGFNVVRAYIFGDTIAGLSGLEKVGVPDFAGYALGYKLVREYQRRTGATIAEATFEPARAIIERSGFFDLPA